MDWEDINKAPKDGTAFLAWGLHNTTNYPYWEEGDEWWAIILWDIWRGEDKWVFSKDGSNVWSEPLKFSILTTPEK